MEEFDLSTLKNIFIPKQDSHKGENGKLMVIGGSVLFHAASLWSLKIASRIVDMVFYSSVDSNNIIVQKEKHEFRDGIIVPRNKIEHYITEADCVLIGLGLPREDGIENGDDDTKIITESLIKNYSKKKWVIDGGSLQVINPDLLPQNAVITPHKKEFEVLFGLEPTFKNALEMAKKYGITILLKGKEDLVANGSENVIIKGGNQGMTKGGTGDVLAGLTAAFYCKNGAFLSASSAAYINKKAGESLYKTMGLYYNASDLVNEIPKVMKELIL